MNVRGTWVAAALLLAGCSSGGNSGGGGGDDECRLTAQLSGGLDAALGNASQACIYTARYVAFAPLDGNGLAIGLRVQNIEAGQTGSFPAQMDVGTKQDRWSGAICTVDVESNVPAPPTYDAGMSFNPHQLRGKGSCSTPAVHEGDGGTKPPIDIGRFTFSFTSLFY